VHTVFLLYSSKAFNRRERRDRRKGRKETLLFFIGGVAQHIGRDQEFGFLCELWIFSAISAVKSF
jgi:hypothetical protein